MQDTNSLERLPDSELQVMKIIWNNETPIGTGKITDILSEEKHWSRSTIQVLLSRLEERRFIQCQKQGRLKYYIPLVKEEDYCAKETKTFLEHFYNNSYKKLISSLVESNTIGVQDIDDIIEIITDKKNNQ